MSNPLDDFTKLCLLSLTWNELRALARLYRVKGRSRKELVFELVPKFKKPRR